MQAGLISLAIFLSLSAPGVDAPTFSQHVAPIVWKHCAGCHRPGEVGPFSLLTYEDMAKRADFIVDITSSRRMPPWKAEPSFGQFHNERRLSDEELATLRAWAKAGAPRGDERELPKPPQFTDGWTLGKPDLILEMPEAFSVPASGADIYQCFVLPIPTSEHRTVSAVEFRPGNRRVVHHALLFLDSNGAARKRDEREAGPGYRSFGGPGVIPTGGLGGWAPGAMPRYLPEGTGMFLRKGSDLVLQLHYHPSGKAESDRSSVGIYFTKQLAPTIVGGLAVRSRQLNIPPDEKHYRVTAESEALPVDINVLGVGPHMHLLGRQMKATAKKPDGSVVPLIWIKDWDFNWQGGYAFAENVRLPKGTIIHIEAEYDNSADNPHNPSSPPKRVHWGEQTTDEMCLLSVQLTTDSVADLRKIVTMRSARLGAALVGGVDEQDLPGGVVPDRAARIEVFVDALLDRGFVIPEPARELLRFFDKDSDSRLDREEYDQIPIDVRNRIRDEIRRRVREVAEPSGG